MFDHLDQKHFKLSNFQKDLKSKSLNNQLWFGWLEVFVQKFQTPYITIIHSTHAYELLLQQNLSWSHYKDNQSILEEREKYSFE